MKAKSTWLPSFGRWGARSGGKPITASLGLVAKITRLARGVVILSLPKVNRSPLAYSKIQLILVVSGVAASLAGMSSNPPSVARGILTSGWNMLACFWDSRGV